MAKRRTQVRKTEKTERDNDNHRRDRNEKREPASLFRTEYVEQSDREDGRGRESLRIRNSEILEGRQGADRGRDQIIGNQQKRADDRDHFAAMPHTRVNAAAVGIKAANDHVINPDERG